MPELSLSDVMKVKGDRLLVKKLSDQPDKIGSIFIPDSAKDAAGSYDRSKAWKGELLKCGDKVDLTEFDKFGDAVSIGSTLVLTPVSIDCPNFKAKNEQGNYEHYIFVREEDVLGVEVPVTA